MKDGDNVRIEVEDSGEGMAPELAKRIVEEQQPSEEPSARGHSTGIGFSNVVRRLRLFTGKDDVIEIGSAVPHGTKISLKIPMAGRVEQLAEANDRGR
ncbi:Histidine kinase-, DNA gyrase B-, and HSP90-like ATPase [compost metagenome]